MTQVCPPGSRAIQRVSRKGSGGPARNTWNSTDVTKGIPVGNDVALVPDGRRCRLVHGSCEPLRHVRITDVAGVAERDLAEVGVRVGCAEHDDLHRCPLRGDDGHLLVGGEIERGACEDLAPARSWPRRPEADVPRARLEGAHHESPVVESRADLRAAGADVDPSGPGCR
jgi:hypothetical protein